MRLIANLGFSVTFGLVIFFVSLAISNATFASASILKADWQPFINGGEQVPTSDSISKSTVMLETDAQYCSATIISDQLLLTAAHCIGVSEPWVMIHFVGLEGAVSRKASRSLRHEAYQDLGETTRNDVALVFFTGGLPAGFVPVSLLPSEQDLNIADELVVAGYGEGGPLGNLAKLSLKVTEFLDGKNLIKLGQSTKRGICHGDSGGPAYKVIKGQLYLAGVASYTNEIDCSGFSVYTRATPFQGWIEQHGRNL